MPATASQNRRKQADRRQHDSANFPQERRGNKLGRRMTDKQSERIHALFLSVLGGIILLQLVMALIGSNL